MKILTRISRLALILWAGSLWSLLWVTAVLFQQSDRHLAGQLAARLFQIETYLGFGAAAALALLRPARRRYVWGYVAAALLSLNEWILKPLMQAAQSAGTAAGLSFGAWHGMSALLYVGACVAVLALLWGADPSVECRS